MDVFVRLTNLNTVRSEYKGVDSQKQKSSDVECIKWSNSMSHNLHADLHKY